MIKKTRKQTDRFVAFDDNGNQFIIIETTTYTTVSGKLPTARVAGKPTYRLITGEAVRLSDTEFEVARSRVRLHRQP